MNLLDDMNNFCRDSLYDSEGHLLAEKPIDSVDAVKRRKISDARNKLEYLTQMAKNFDEGIDFLTTTLLNMEEHLFQLVHVVSITRQEEHEAFLGCSIPSEISVLSPTNIRTKGRCKRIRDMETREKIMKVGKKRKGR